MQTALRTTPAPCFQNPGTIPIKRMTTEELNERHRKGLCFKCNDKFGPRHVCKKLFLIQATLKDSNEDIEMEEDGPSEEKIPDRPEISLHAIAGFRNPNTIRVKGCLSQKPVTVLINSGSTHNFINEQLAKKVGLQPYSCGNLEVMVAFRERLSSLGKCKNLQLILQGHPIQADSYLLPLEGCDVVLGA